MKRLLKLYSDLEQIYERLDNLIRAALYKALQASHEWLQEDNPEEKFNENEYDQIAYSDAVNRRFELYYVAVCKFLKLFLQERYAVRTCSTHELFKVCYDKKLITEKELAECLKLIDYVSVVRKPTNKCGDALFTQEILSYTVTINELSDRLAALIKRPNANVTRVKEKSSWIPH